MVDFRKRISKKRESKRINPIEIYEHLDRSSDIGDLREVQKNILLKWQDGYRANKDTILKLHTGQGKTIVGLLMLQSYLNECEEPCVYLCPNNYLMKQTCEQAERFGIPYVTVEGDLPSEFLEGDKILITSCQKMFNGLTKFGLKQNYIKVHSIVLDDAHACAEVINDTFKIKVNEEHKLYEEILSIFTTSLKNQGIGTFTDIKNGEYDAILPIPYWEWQNKHEEVTNIIAQHSRNDNDIKFAWPLIKDIIKYCTCIISGKGLEIYPEIGIIEKYSSFHNAKSRIYMSATVSDDSLFIKDLGVDKESIENPLTLEDEKWNGEKMILIPQRIDTSIKKNDLIKLFTKRDVDFGIVVLSPSFLKSKKWEESKGLIVNSDDIFDKVDELKKGNYENVLIFSNRYDGIDLPDNACRILIIDGKPSGASIEDRYNEMVISDSDILQRKCAQKIEQGFGRAVRGKKDYAAVIIIDNELIKFIRSSSTQKYFSDQTRTQINIGLDITEFAIEDMQTEQVKPMDSFVKLINQLLSRDEGWKEFYEEQMNSMESLQHTNRFLEIFDYERKAGVAFMRGNHEVAVRYLQEIIDKYYNNSNDLKGWYLQKIAQYTTLSDPINGNKIQINAHKLNPYLLKPQSGMEFKRLDTVDAFRIERIKEWIQKFKDFNQMMLSVNENVSLLEFGISSEKFERTLDSIGTSLGFVTERPERKWKDGSDNLWHLDKNKYLLIECKNEVKETRTEIYKKEAGQINTSCAWFKSNYPNCELNPLMIINATRKGFQVHFNEDVKVMNRTKMELFKTNYWKFFNSFNEYKIDSITTSEIQTFIEQNRLTVEDILNHYSVSPR
ncbi:MAG: DEAD/DEAH box helicase [Firmicutes bacterium]|nr:DEAD/DEAH box helicase [Bacillota bacterium]